MIRQYAYKFRLYPTDGQETLLAKHFGCVRWTYNHFLEERNRDWLESKEKGIQKKRRNYHDDAMDLVVLKKLVETKWLSECNSQSLQQVLMDLETAHQRFFGKRSGHPNFKSRNGKQSFRVPQHLKVLGDMLFIPKFPEGIRTDGHRKVEGEIRSATVSTNRAGNHFVSILVEKDIQPKPKVDKAIGIDLGISTLATCSDGTTFDNVRPFKGLEDRIGRASRTLSRTQKGSNGRGKARLKLARLHEKVANIRSNHLHQVSSRIVGENQAIFLENLNVT